MVEQQVSTKVTERIASEFRELRAPDYALGVGVAVALSGAAITYEVLAARTSDSNADTQSVPLKAQQDTVSSEQSFMDNVYSAINNKEDPNYVEAATFDHKSHTPRKTLAEEKAVRTFNQQYKDYERDGELSLTLRGIVSARNAHDANNLIVLESNKLTDRSAAITTQLDNMANSKHAKAGDTLPIFGEVTGAILIGLIVTWGSRKFRKVRQQRQTKKQEDAKIQYEVEDIHKGVEELLKESGPPDAKC